MSTYNLIWLLWQLQQDASNRVWSRKSGPKTRKQDMAYALLSSAPCSSPFPLFTDRRKMRCATLADTHMTYQHLLTHISHGYILLLTHICDMCDVARHGILLLHPLADTHITWHPLATSSCSVSHPHTSAHTCLYPKHVSLHGNHVTIVIVEKWLSTTNKSPRSKYSTRMLLLTCLPTHKKQKQALGNLNK